MKLWYEHECDRCGQRLYQHNPYSQAECAGWVFNGWGLTNDLVQAYYESRNR